MRARGRRRALVLPALACLLGVTACSDGDGVDRADRAAVATTTSTSRPTGSFTSLTYNDVIDRFLFRSDDEVTLTPTRHRFERETFVDPAGRPLSDHDPLAVDWTWSS